MPHSHTHEHLPSSAVRTSPRTKAITAALLLLVAGATAFGLMRLWPDYSEVGSIAESTQYAAPGTSFEQGEVTKVDMTCPTTESQGDMPAADPGLGPGIPQHSACIDVRVELRSGPDTGLIVQTQLHGSLATSGLRAGDRVEMIGTPVPTDPGAQTDSPGAAEQTPGADTAYQIVRTYDVSGVFRHLPLALLTLLFVVVVVAVGRLRGLLALLALGISAAVLLAFVLPALVGGGPGLLIGMVGASAIMFVILYLVHGPNMRTTSALIGTLCGILIMAAISQVAVQITRLSGIGDEASGMLSGLSSTIDFRGLLSCSIIIAGLGVLNDVTITQASSVWELRAAAPEMTRGEVYRRAMRIGRDHIASTVYTVFFAYVGAALSVLILLYLYDRPFLSLLTREDIAIEIVRTLCGSVGLVLAVPITTWVAALFAVPSRSPILEA